MNALEIKITSLSHLADAFWVMKNELGLSNEFCDVLGGLTRGHTDKLLGPTRVKNLSEMTVPVYYELLGVSLRLEIDLEAVQRMAARWEKRNKSQIRVVTRPMSSDLIERAKPVIYSEMARKRATVLTASIRSEIARKAAHKRWHNRKRRVKNGCVGKGNDASSSVSKHPAGGDAKSKTKDRPANAGRGRTRRDRRNGRAAAGADAAALVANNGRADLVGLQPGI